MARRHISFKWLPIWIDQANPAQFLNNLASARPSYATNISSRVKCRIINGPVCYQNDKLDHTFHVDYALQWVFTFECPLKSEYLFISAQMHVLPSKQLKLLGICEDGTCPAQSKHQPLCISSWKYGQSSRHSYWPLCPSRSSLELYSFNLSEIHALKFKFTSDWAYQWRMPTTFQVCSGICYVQILELCFYIKLEKLIIINHLVNRVKIHAWGNKSVSSAIFDQ